MQARDAAWAAHSSPDIFFFFFQAEDGIRDYKVTGVQTCALPISPWQQQRPRAGAQLADAAAAREDVPAQRRPHCGDLREERPALRAHRTPDRKSTRLNSSHLVISYAVFCLKKKKNLLISTISPTSVRSSHADCVVYV